MQHIPYEEVIIATEAMWMRMSDQTQAHKLRAEVVRTLEMAKPAKSDITKERKADSVISVSSWISVCFTYTAVGGAWTRFNAL